MELYVSDFAGYVVHVPWFLGQVIEEEGEKKLFYWELSWNCFICTVKIWRKTFDSVAITNKMQLGNGIYYSTVH